MVLTPHKFLFQISASRPAGMPICHVGKYKVIFTILNDSTLIIRIRHRKEVYKN
ncbi:MAG: type II toxin-antitoxin system RelE/ParE family toxin [Candidatus Sabulitectum sp.]|nr:type II toxin-antitoxin system RelE/ParE family toxin [Candidatus Sabulitectum sp.]